MKIFSELTNKYYSTVEECLNAEKKYNEEKNKELEEKRAREEERKAMETYVNTVGATVDQILAELNQ